MTYGAEFYAEETRVAQESAAIVMPRILEETGARSVIDIGCGTGSWAQAATSLGVLSMGVDWNVPGDLVLIDTYLDQDLRHGYPCWGFDLAVCLEVAEHLPEDSADPLVTGLCQADTVLFSAATPGQPGVGHVNCQPHGYWHDLFAAEGFVPEFIGGWFDEPVADFYRRNLYLYRRGA